MQSFGTKKGSFTKTIKNNRDLAGRDLLRPLKTRECFFYGFNYVILIKIECHASMIVLRAVWLDYIDLLGQCLHCPLMQL